ncbi:MAG: ABC transporter ATP-binding protein [Ezakiella sp.]|nr:ABC transporter ATP-binding protein/permease [Ezakiella sp.]MDD7761319.1 ABC transporter ATP-binding protein [Bacillota bacterium]MDY3947134.1 ABC transporter ATP-binding protein [Ezakiella sp.]
MKIVFKHFNDAVKRFPKHFIRTFFLSILAAIVSIAIPIAMRQLIEGDFSSRDIVVNIIILSAMILLSIIIAIKKTKTMDEFGGEYLKDILKRVEHILYNTNYERVDELNKNGLSHTLFSDAMTIMSTVGLMIPSFISSVIIVLFLLAISFYFNPLIALISMIAILAGVAISFFARKKMYNTSKGTNRKLKIVHDFTNELTNTTFDARHNRLGVYYAKKTDSIIDDFIKTAKEEDVTRELYNELIINYNLIIQVLVSVLLSIPFINNSISNALFFIMVFNLLITQGSNIEIYLGQIISSLVSFNNIEKILKLPMDSAKEEINSIDEISIRDLSFNHGEDKLFDGLNIDFKKGDTILIEGANGSGKSTFLKLLLKYYEYDGSIKYNGLELREIKREALYKKMLYINQKEIILNEDIDDFINITLDENISQLEVHKFMDSYDFKKDYKEKLEYDKLSGGEIKKLLIAKLFFASPKRDVILIDEIEAGLDDASLAKLSFFLNKIAGTEEKIIFIISHGDKLKVNCTKRLRLSHE